MDQYFNDSTGAGDDEESDSLGPWNEGGDWEIVEAPPLEQEVENFNGADGEEENGAKRKTSSKDDAKSRKRAS